MKVTLQELVQGNIKVHGFAWTAKHYKRKMCFTHFYWLAFGRAPRFNPQAPIPQVQKFYHEVWDRFTRLPYGI